MSPLQKWPNGMGYDLGNAEIWIHEDAFRVFTPDRVLRVPYYVTRDPESAYILCVLHGLNRAELDDMKPEDANALYFAHAPKQKLFTFSECGELKSW